ncbi:protein arginine N-methyltransferase 5-like [Convolutriloba macropyga]|uniref:protein arginine N-methyltransferase 5-like n=1 Tax=Convolutriloba macropyga TaxID=536237 RepID=UPI003F51F005
MSATPKKRERLSAGVELSSCGDIKSALECTKESGYEFVVLPIKEPSQSSSECNSATRSFKTLRECFNSRADLTVETSDWNSLVVFRTTPSEINCDATSSEVRVKSEGTLCAELSYATYLAIPAVIIPLQPGGNANLSRIVYNHCAAGASNFQIWMEVPVALTNETGNGAVNGYGSTANNISGDHADTEDEYTKDMRSWKLWDEFRTVNAFNKRLGVLLRITEDLPSSENVWQNWIGEPIKALAIDTSVFMTNKSGFPVLSQAHQHYICRLFTYFLNLQFVVSTGKDLQEISSSPRQSNTTAYYQYLNHLYGKREPFDSIEDFAFGYENYLQVPLQPLADNLESQTYEVFEKDPVKYPKYQEAVQLAIRDKRKQYPSRPLVLMVLGAGRGPLVTCCIEAAKLEDYEDYVLYAVEKNPNSLLTLEYKLKHMWNDKVRIIASDMRDADSVDKADIIVSELLGSFGDNELSPECLDGAVSLLKPDAISIPSSYTSYISPISSHVLHVECVHSRELDKATDHSLETPYVVRLVNFTPLGDVKPLFTYEHPNWSEKIDNRRQDVVEFESKATSVITGIAGYFDTVLYKDVSFSINPDTHSEGMFSWFPILFPLKQHIRVNKGEKISVHFWRCEDAHKVWYEWCVSQPNATAIHNARGKSYFIGK